jgi:hypothetical protein
LLDANVIIESHALGLWDSLVASFDLLVPSVVSRHEARYFVVKDKISGINLRASIARNEIRELAAEVADIAA